jgi:hypothetical protein
MRYLVLLVLATALTTPLSSSAQGCQYTSPSAEEDVSQIAPMFYDPEYAEDRGTTIQLLTSADTARVVRDDSVCQVVVNQAIAHLRQNSSVWNAGQEGKFQATVYRFGPYYAVSVVPEDRSPPPAPGTLDMVRHDHRSVLLVYRASDLALLRVLA